ncbi:DEAD-domain-containing protein [Metschnikowia bicuspidata var. bicuspidata NRRL YB-4993]|uniref:ATP-dependent RNA helicase n=1 Tax=Metschnikowia bicuspidata var. bicuspidata NRRL YB-4993 TaxID=869754 RepID=A0A1A0H5G0_9ASCO|nr:DEAD-domain-containing protein [Metschnikowia bicuspidata var. bicuspidata NRRL YB-4993]OBA19158.1 DEAD-domain-containing protein [Metschnikowia bicuspidata var. bicuspidata NRRL YB-4993]
MSSDTSNSTDSSESSDSDQDTDQKGGQDRDQENDQGSDPEAKTASRAPQHHNPSQDAARVSVPDPLPQPFSEDSNAPPNDHDMDVDSGAPEETPGPAKHASILKKFAKSTQNQDVSESESDTEMEDAKDLAPMPQPELPRDRHLVSHQFHQKNLEWLASPTYSLPEVTRPFSEFGISPKILANLTALGFSNAFSVQVAVLNEAMSDLRKNKLAPDFQGDILVNASTGSGKTLAYLIPIVEALHTRVVPRLRAIVLVPTKPLINQVAATLRSVSKGTVLSIVCLTNDKSIKDEGTKISRNEPDIIVSTPGRLVDHLLNGSILMQALRFLVIDEADRLLNQSFQNWCEVVVSAMEKCARHSENTGTVWKLQPQKMIFSATLTTDAGKLSLLKFTKPRLIVVNSKEQLVNEMFSVPATLQEHKLRFSSHKSALKPLLLAKFLLHTRKLQSVLVFAKSNDATLRLARILNDLFSQLAPELKTNVAFINATNNMSSVRKRILRDFADGNINVLVATDLIARGLDVLSITDVVNYDVPNSSREYVHRVGRTARANHKGEAFTFCFGNGESRWFNNIMVDVARVEPIIELEEEPVLELEMTVYKRVMAEFQESMKNEG